MTLRKVKGNLERLFDKNQSDLVRGLRNNKNNEHKYITQCIEEIKEELKQDNLSVKANAIAKLTYLQMLGYDISWAAFNMIEVMSSVKFTHKRIGYLCASQCFHENIDVMMLTTNMIRKDLHSQSMYDAGLALSGLACFVNNDIARDLFNDVLMQLNSTKPYLRKKAVLTIYKIFLKYPDALKIAFPRLKEKLEDPDPGVQSAAVNVICELARKNPKNYLCLAPIFFKLMQNSTNNWMLIKIIKLFGALTPLEPRLGKKLIAPLTNLIHSTTAMSLLYECINTVIAVLISISSGLPDHNSSIKLCVQKLGVLIEDTDQNLKYLGLLAMARILKTHPKTVQSHKDLVLSCLEDKDESIRLRALDLIIGMISKKNLIEIIHRLMQSVKNSSLGNKYRDELIFKIIEICSQNDYSFISNFEWYISVLVDLSQVEGGTMHANLIARQLFDVTIRVESITEFSTQQMSIMIENAHVFTDFCDVLYAAAFICGEFSCYLKDKKQACLNLLDKKFEFPSYIQATFLQNSLKIFVKYIENEKVESLVNLCDEINILLKPFLLSDDFEVQERAATYQQLLNFVRDEYIHKLNNNSIKNKETQNSSELDQEKDLVSTNDSLMNTNNSLVNTINDSIITNNGLVNTNNGLDNINNDLENNNNDLENENSESSNNLVNSTNNLVDSFNDYTKLKDELQDFNLESIVFAYSIKPVAAKAQKKVPIPADLDLDTPFHELENSDNEDKHKKEFGSDSDLFSKHESDTEEITKVKKKKKRSKHKKDKKESKSNNENHENNEIHENYDKEENPMYLKSKSKSKDKNNEKTFEDNEVLEAEEAINCELESNKIIIPGLVSYDKYFKENKLSKTSKSKKKDKKKTKSNKEDKTKDVDELIVEEEKKIKILGLEMPEGIELVNENDDENDENDNEDPHKALANVTFDDYIEEEKALKALNEVSLKEKKKTSKTKNKEENGLENKERRKKKSKKESNEKKKKSKKSKSKDEEKTKNDDSEKAISNENNIENEET